MNNLTDQQLLADYAGSRSEAAFTELVRRYVDLVHSAAWRMTGESHSAQDVTQAVFVALAQNAARLAGHPVLSAWLHTTARNLAAKHVRATVRRQYREQEAVAMNELHPTTDASWLEIAPQLDAALGELSEADRDAVMLRYFEKKSAAEMGQILGITDEAAQKRASRAVDKLREFFSKRKINIGAGSLGILISANAVQAAPVGLVATISAAAAAGTAVATSTVITATKTLAMTTLQKTIVTVATVVLVGAGIYEAKQAHDARAEMQTLREQQLPLAGQIQQLQNNYADATNRLANLLAENSRLKSNPHETEILKLRGELTRLENQADDPVEKSARAWLNQVNRLKARLEKTPAAYIPELKLATDRDWLSAVNGNALNSDADYRRALSSLRGIEENKVANRLKSALTAYMHDNVKQFPTDLTQLQPYFDSPMDDSILARWEIAPASTIRNLGMGGNSIITQKMPVDEVFDQRYGIGSDGFGTTDFLQTTGVYKTMQPVFEAYRAAHNGEWQTDMSQLQPYATTPEQQAALQKLILKNSSTRN